jgi:hypothetical protein
MGSRDGGLKRAWMKDGAASESGWSFMVPSTCYGLDMTRAPPDVALPDISDISVFVEVKMLA